jgi:hypothetical protein
VDCFGDQREDEEVTDSVDALLREADEICEKATPGEWAWEFAHPGFLLMQVDPANPHKHLKCVLDGKQSDDFNDCNVIGDQDDFAFIARSRTLLPALAAALRESQAVLAKMEAAQEAAFIYALDARQRMAEEFTEKPLRERADRAEALAKRYEDALRWYASDCKNIVRFTIAGPAYYHEYDGGKIARQVLSTKDEGGGDV